MAPDTPTQAGPQGRMWQFRFPDWRWTHIDFSDDTGGRALAAEGWIPGDALDLLRDQDGSFRLEISGGVAMGVMPDFANTGGLDTVSPWRFAMRDDVIVTAQAMQTRNVIALCRACRTERAPAGPAELVDLILAGFAADATQRAAALDDEATEIEDALLDGHGRAFRSIGQRLGRVRRETTRLQRVVTPVERLTRDEVHALPGWLASKSHEATRRRLITAVEELRALAEHGRALQDELAARQAEATTRTLNALSVLSAVLLPPTLVTGFFGMNTEGLPFKEGESGTLFAASIALCSIGLTLTLLLALRRRA